MRRVPPGPRRLRPETRGLGPGLLQSPAGDAPLHPGTEERAVGPGRVPEPVAAQRRPPAPATARPVVPAPSPARSAPRPQSLPTSRPPGPVPLQRSAAAALPGGGLAAHEDLGARVLARHAGVTVGTLADRLEAEPWLLVASSFAGRTLAEAAIARVLAVEHSRVGGWLSARRRADLVLARPLDLPVGILLRRGATRPEPTAWVRIVLRPDTVVDPGYRIISAHPVVPVPRAAPALRLPDLFAACLHQDADPAASDRALADQARRTGGGAAAAAAAAVESLLLQSRDDGALLAAMIAGGCEVAPADRPLRAWLAGLARGLVAAPPVRRGASGMQLRWSR